MGILFTQGLAQAAAGLVQAATSLGAAGFANQATAPAQMSDITMRAIIYVLLAAGLITFLLVGALVVLNYGMMSRRPDDQIGRRTPSTPGLFKGQLWPDEPYQENALPAEEEESEVRARGELPPRTGTDG